MIKKKIEIIILLLSMAVGCNAMTASAADYAFVDEGTTSSWTWAKSSIYSAYERGIIAGKEGNVFDAEGTVTRAEAATMLVRWKGIDPDEYSEVSGVFSDVDADKWYAKFVNAAYENDLIAGKGEGIFDPEGWLTRAEAAALLVTGAGWIADAPDAGFTDVPEGWYTGYINTANLHGIMSGMGEGICKPFDNVTRAQFVVMLENIYMTAEDAQVSCVEYIYDANGKIEKELWRETENSAADTEIRYVYNEDGLLIQKVQTNIEGDLEYTTDYTYDSVGKMLTETQTDAEGEMCDRMEYTYDAEGHLLTEKEIWFDGSYGIYTYDAEGRQIKYASYETDNTLKKVTEYRYSEDNRTVTILNGDSENTVVSGTYKDEYNTKGNLVNRVYYDADNEVIWYWRYTYDTEGKLIQEATYDSEKKIGPDNYWTIYEYDEVGHKIKEILHNEWPMPTVN